MKLNELEYEVESMLASFRVNYKKDKIQKALGVRYIIDDFGIIICAYLPIDYVTVNEMVKCSYAEGWRTIYFNIDDNFNDKRKELLWILGKSGYFRWIRNKFPKQFKDMLIDYNLSTDIINKRLELYDNKPKYKFFIEDNIEAKKLSINYILSIDPGFFDYIPDI